MLVDWQEYHGRNRDSADALRGRQILIVGLGAMGSHLAFALGRAGTSLLLLDFDTLEVANLHRHSIGEPAYAGWMKVEAVADRLRRELPDETLVSPVVGDVLHMDRAWLRNAITNSDLVIAATGNHEANILLNHECRRLETDLIIPSLWVDPDTVGDIYVLPYSRWGGNRNDRALGCYACDDRSGRPNEFAGQPGSFAEIAWVGSAAAELGSGLLLPAEHRSRQMADSALASRNYFIFERMPLRTQGGGVEINPSCGECNPRLSVDTPNQTRSSDRTVGTANELGRPVRDAAVSAMRLRARAMAATLTVTLAIVAMSAVVLHPPSSPPRSRSFPPVSAPPARKPMARSPSQGSLASSDWLTSTSWRPEGDATIELVGGMLAISSTGGDIAGALFPVSSCDYVVSGEERIVHGEGVGVAVRASVTLGVLHGVALQYDRRSGVLFDAHYPENVGWLQPARTNGAWHQFVLQVSGPNYRMSLDGEPLFAGKPTASCGGIYFHVWGDTLAYFRNVSVSSIRSA